MVPSKIRQLRSQITAHVALLSTPAKDGGWEEALSSLPRVLRHLEQAGGGGLILSISRHESAGRTHVHCMISSPSGLPIGPADADLAQEK